MNDHSKGIVYFEFTNELDRLEETCYVRQSMALGRVP